MTRVFCFGRHLWNMGKLEPIKPYNWSTKYILYFSREKKHPFASKNIIIKKISKNSQSRGKRACWPKQTRRHWWKYHPQYPPSACPHYATLTYPSPDSSCPLPSHVLSVDRAVASREWVQLLVYTGGTSVLSACTRESVSLSAEHHFHLQTSTYCLIWQWLGNISSLLFLLISNHD